MLRLKGDEVLTTGCPYTEGKEHLGGFTAIQAPDLDAALEWGRKLARAVTLPIEVRHWSTGPTAENRCATGSCRGMLTQRHPACVSLPAAVLPLTPRLVAELDT